MDRTVNAPSTRKMVRNMMEALIILNLLTLMRQCMGRPLQCGKLLCETDLTSALVELKSTNTTFNTNLGIYPREQMNRSPDFMCPAGTKWEEVSNGYGKTLFFCGPESLCQEGKSKDYKKI